MPCIIGLFDLPLGTDDNNRVCQQNPECSSYEESRRGLTVIFYIVSANPILFARLLTGLSPHAHVYGDSGQQPSQSRPFYKKAAAGPSQLPVVAIFLSQPLRNSPLEDSARECFGSRAVLPHQLVTSHGGSVFFASHLGLSQRSLSEHRLYNNQRRWRFYSFFMQTFLRASLLAPLLLLYHVPFPFRRRSLSTFTASSTSKARHHSWSSVCWYVVQAHRNHH